MCNFWNFGQWPSFMHKFGNFENRPASWKLVLVDQKLAQFRPPGVERQLFQMITNDLSPWKLGHNSKRLIVERNRLKIWPMWVYVAEMLVFFTWNMSRSLGDIWCTFPKKLRNSRRTTHCRAKKTKNWASGRGKGVYITCMLVFLTLNRSRSFEVMHYKHHDQSTEAYGPLV